MRGGLAFFRDGGLLATHGVGDGLGLALGPDAVGPFLGVFRVLFPLRVEPLGRVGASLGTKAGMDFPVVAADELADLLFAFHHHRQRRGLHPAHGGQEEATVARVERRHGARAVDADQPIGLRAAARGVGQRLHLLVGAQRAKTVANGLRRHALQPQARDRFAQWFGATGVLLDQAEDQLAFSARVTGVDQLVHVLAFGQSYHGVEPGLGLVHGLEVKVRRNHRQIGKAPFSAFDVEFLGCLDLHQMAHGTGNDVAVALKVLVVFLEFACRGRECTHDILGDRGLFCNDQCFHLTTIQFSRARRCAPTHAGAPMRAHTIHHTKFLSRGKKT